MTVPDQPQQLRAYPGDTNISYRSWLVGEGSSRSTGRTRWSEVKIYDTGETYMAEIAGVTLIPGEETRHTLLVCTNADSLVSALQRRQQGRSPGLAPYIRAALEQAANGGDEEVREALETLERALRA